MSKEPEGEPEATPKAGGRWRRILLIGLPLLLVLAGGGGGAAYVTGMVPPGLHAAGDAADEAAMAGDPADVVFVELPDLLINLNSSGARLRFLKIATALEVDSEEQAETVRRLVPRILDSYHMYLRAVRPEELQGSEGMYRIKEELLARTNDAIRPAEVRDVLVREMLVQ
ncbi:MAG TPA: flagellar basal body-associated FliL family protein [Geminicoccaceae bacterium]|nr:flagellar basal body-associated FliL family protein [Geminicoccaceae bacterium]